MQCKCGTHNERLTSGAHFHDCFTVRKERGRFMTQAYHIARIALDTFLQYFSQYGDHLLSTIGIGIRAAHVILSNENFGADIAQMHLSWCLYLLQLANHQNTQRKKWFSKHY